MRIDCLVESSSAAIRLRELAVYNPNPIQTCSDAEGLYIVLPHCCDRIESPSLIVTSISWNPQVCDPQFILHNSNTAHQPINACSAPKMGTLKLA